MINQNLFRSGIYAWPVSNGLPEVGNSGMSQKKIAFNGSGYYLSGGFNPSEKYESQIGSSSQLLGIIKNASNHQPVTIGEWFIDILVFKPSIYNCFFIDKRLKVVNPIPETKSYLPNDL